jgi:hypothetical protein
VARPVVRRALFYDLVGVGLTAYAGCAYRIRTIGRQLRLEPSTLLVANHPRESDPVVMVGALYRHVHRFGRKHRLVHFMLRADLGERGFFAGMPLGLPLWARRLLFPIGVGSLLERWLPCAPIRAADTMLVVDLIRAAPESRLEDVLPPADVIRLRERASLLGRPRPRVGRDVLHGIYADLLWWVVPAEDAPTESASALFACRAGQARADLERFVGVLRSGGVLLISPEGRASPDGRLQPLRRGALLLVRRAKPTRVWPLAVAYDGLTTGRTWAYVGVGTPVPAEEARTEGALRSLLTRTLPLTVGQVVADALDCGTTASLERRLADEVADAQAQGRFLSPGAVGAGGCRRGLRRRLRFGGLRAGVGCRAVFPGARGLDVAAVSTAVGRGGGAAIGGCRGVAAAVSGCRARRLVLIRAFRARRDVASRGMVTGFMPSGGSARKRGRGGLNLAGTICQGERRTRMCISVNSP